jgi:hypothetical protein
LSGGPWVVVRCDGQLVEFCDRADQWTPFLEDAQRIDHEQVAQHFAAELEDEGHGKPEAVTLEQARKLVAGGVPRG